MKKKQKIKKRSALDCLVKASSIDSSRKILLELGTKQIVQPFVDNPKSELWFVGCLIQALLSASDTNNNENENSKDNNNVSTSPIVLKKIIESLNTFATTIAMKIDTMPGYNARCSIIAIAIRSLATNESNLHELQKKRSCFNFSFIVEK